MHMSCSARSTLVLFFSTGPGICQTLMTESTQSAAPTAEAPAPTPTFSDFGLHPLLLQSIAETGYTTPTPIQAQAIPVAVSYTHLLSPKELASTDLVVRYRVAVARTPWR